MSEVENKREKYLRLREKFDPFRMDRIREGRDFEEIQDEKVSLKEIKKAMNRWAMEKEKPSLDMLDLKFICDEIFGESKGQNKEYSHIRVFHNEEDIEYFDQQEEKKELVNLREENKDLEKENNKLRQELSTTREAYTNTSLLLNLIWNRTEYYSDTIDSVVKQLLELQKSLYSIHPKEPVSSDAP